MENQKVRLSPEREVEVKLEIVKTVLDFEGTVCGGGPHDAIINACERYYAFVIGDEKETEENPYQKQK